MDRKVGQGLMAWRRVPAGVRTSAVVAVTNPVIRVMFNRATQGRLRILGYHGVENMRVFESAVAHIVSRYTVVSGDDIVAAARGSSPLPPRAVWFTFDDGLASTFAAGPMLARHGVQATVFVNPATFATPSLLWFQVLESARRANLISPGEVERFSRDRLKSLHDPDRRVEIGELAERLAGHPDSTETWSGTRSELEAWVAMGHEVGNHTWDHPCLDRCGPDEQELQIRSAHDWLLRAGVTPRFFAYPNGDWTAHAAGVAAELGYVGSLLFDHRLARPSRDPHRLSRLKIDSSAPIRRVDAILSGAHSAALAPLRFTARNRHSTVIDDAETSEA